MENITFEQGLILLGNRVKELRMQQNMTIEQLSEKSGIKTKYLKRIENGQSVLTPVILTVFVKV